MQCPALERLWHLLEAIVLPFSGSNNLHNFFKMSISLMINIISRELSSKRENHRLKSAENGRAYIDELDDANTNFQSLFAFTYVYIINIYTYIYIHTHLFGAGCSNAATTNQQPPRVHLGKMVRLRLHCIIHWLSSLTGDQGCSWNPSTGRFIDCLLA